MEQMNTMQAATYSTSQVVRHTGATFRMIDYWIRNGHVTIRRNASGSGTRRRWSRQELDALLLCVEQVAEAQDTLDRWASGELWEDCLKAVAR